MTRIISGAARGRRLRTPAGGATRPTSDRVREALFSALDARLGGLQRTRFLDVFAGSGAVGLEARSRGADGVTLIESDRSTAALIRTNARTLGLVDVTVLTGKADRFAAEPPQGGAFDVAFLDPPYSTQSIRVTQLITRLCETGWFAASAMVIVERSSRDVEWRWPPGFDAVQSKRYGETMLWYGQRASR